MMIGFLTLAAIAIIMSAGKFKESNNDSYISGRYDSLEHVITNPTMPEEIIHYTGMTISYNRRAHLPIWVALELTCEETLLEEPRAQNFVTY